MSYRSKSVEVYIELDDFDDDELIDELEDRGYKVFKFDDKPFEGQDKLLHELYLDYVDGKNLDKIVKKVLDELYMYVPLRNQ